MNLYLISQTQNGAYDTYDSAVVCAPDEETARHMDPRDGLQKKEWDHKWSTWCDGPEHVSVQYLGEAALGIEQGVICASFNAG